MTKTKIRVAMRNALYQQDYAHRKVCWEMKRLRHALFDVVTKCPRVKDATFEFERKTHTTICHLIYSSGVVDIYDNQKGLVRVSSEKGNKFAAYSALADVVTELQPKAKIIIKRKVIA